MPSQTVYDQGKSWTLRPVFEDDVDEHDDRKVKFDDASSQKSWKDSVASEDLFADDIDDIVFEGELMKFKPGLSANF